MELDPGIHIDSTWFVLETGCDNLRRRERKIEMKHPLLQFILIRPDLSNPINGSENHLKLSRTPNFRRLPASLSLAERRLRRLRRRLLLPKFDVFLPPSMMT
jgi:hypothetical protein